MSTAMPTVVAHKSQNVPKQALSFTTRVANNSQKKIDIRNRWAFTYWASFVSLER